MQFRVFACRFCLSFSPVFLNGTREKGETHMVGLSQNYAFEPESHRFKTGVPGPHLVVTARIHGNEPSGEIAVRRIIQEIQDGELALTRGRLTVYPVLNPLAKEKNVRGIWIDANRNIAVHGERDVSTPEHAIRSALFTEFVQHDFAASINDYAWHVLDLHSVPLPGEAHLILSDGPKDLAFAQALGPYPVYRNWRGAQLKVDAHDLHALGHTRDEHTAFTAAIIYGARDQGAASAVCLEAGQDDDPKAPQRAYQAIRNALAYHGLIPAAVKHFGLAKQVVFERVLIRRSEHEQLVDITEDAQRVKPGQVILRGDTREVRVPEEDRNWIIAHPIRAEVGRHCGFLAYEV